MEYHALMCHLLNTPPFRPLSDAVIIQFNSCWLDNLLLYLGPLALAEHLPN